MPSLSSPAVHGRSGAGLFQGSAGTSATEKRLWQQSAECLMHLMAAGVVGSMESLMDISASGILGGVSYMHAANVCFPTFGVLAVATGVAGKEAWQADWRHLRWFAAYWSWQCLYCLVAVVAHPRWTSASLLLLKALISAIQWHGILRLSRLARANLIRGQSFYLNLVVLNKEEAIKGKVEETVHKKVRARRLGGFVGKLINKLVSDVRFSSKVALSIVSKIPVVLAANGVIGKAKLEFQYHNLIVVSVSIEEVDVQRMAAKKLDEQMATRFERVLRKMPSFIQREAEDQISSRVIAELLDTMPAVICSRLRTEAGVAVEVEAKKPVEEAVFLFQTLEYFRREQERDGLDAPEEGATKRIKNDPRAAFARLGSARARLGQVAARYKRGRSASPFRRRPNHSEGDGSHQHLVQSCSPEPGHSSSVSDGEDGDEDVCEEGQQDDGVAESKSRRGHFASVSHHLKQGIAHSTRRGDLVRRKGQEMRRQFREGFLHCSHGGKQGGESVLERDVESVLERDVEAGDVGPLDELGAAASPEEDSGDSNDDQETMRDHDYCDANQTVVKSWRGAGKVQQFKSVMTQGAKRVGERVGQPKEWISQHVRKPGKPSFISTRPANPSASSGVSVGAADMDPADSRGALHAPLLKK
eukprot:TRINITY_DN10269_c0_g1_i1.p1 TRINITY_DN10269_c0_g1~~TRINITY_DN10269_c0_g1_i1.p1  ORF type:complete len:644 (+),score=113.93 TRINITY_DN10269_c0_g1_i1:38-1969(+)